MPVANVPDGYRLTVRYNQSGQEAVSVLGFEAQTGVFLVQSDGQAALNAFWAAFRPVVAGDVSVTGAEWRYLSPSASPVELAAPPSPTGGSSSTTSFAALATLIKWKSNGPGRSGRGKTFLPGVGNVNVASNGRTYSSAHATAVATAITNYLGASAFATAMKPAVISLKNQQAYDITSGSLATVVAIQRRRQR